MKYVFVLIILSFAIFWFFSNPCNKLSGNISQNYQIINLNIVFFINHFQILYFFLFFFEFIFKSLTDRKFSLKFSSSLIICKKKTKWRISKRIKHTKFKETVGKFVFLFLPSFFFFTPRKKIISIHVNFACFFVEYFKVNWLMKYLQ